MIDNIRGSFKDVLNGILTGLPSGFSITEKIYGPLEWEGKQMWGVTNMKLRPFDSFKFKVDEHGNILDLVQEQGADFNHRGTTHSAGPQPDPSLMRAKQGR